jgi:hypothetical protein
MQSTQKTRDEELQDSLSLSVFPGFGPDGAETG